MTDAEFFRQRGFGRRIGFGARPALLVVDMIRAFTDPARPLGSPLEPQIEALRPLLELAHAREILVIFSTVRYDDAALRDAGIWALKVQATATLAADGDGHHVDDRLDKHPSDSLLVKKYASCFFGTDLVSRLNSRRIDTVLLTGCTTSGCIRATAVDALQYGYRPIVVREAVGDRSQAAHDQSLVDLDAKYADVESLQATLAYLSALPVPTPG
jgi:maleamate amidohydrolase